MGEHGVHMMGEHGVPEISDTLNAEYLEYLSTEQGFVSAAY